MMIFQATQISLASLSLTRLEQRLTGRQMRATTAAAGMVTATDATMIWILAGWHWRHVIVFAGAAMTFGARLILYAV